MNDIIKCHSTGKEYLNRFSLLDDLLENKKIILDKKKSIIKNDSIKNNSQYMLPDSYSFKLSKDILGHDFDSNYYYTLVNSTGVFDSHEDVSGFNSWNKTVKDKNGKIYHVIDHDISLKSIVAEPKDVEVYLVNTNYKRFGFGKDINAKLLMFKTRKVEYSCLDFKSSITHGLSLQASARLMYSKIRLAVNSDSSDFKEENALYHQEIDNILNKEVVNENGFFFMVDEQKLHLEGSTVLLGSNSITATHNEPTQPPDGIAIDDTQKEPSIDELIGAINKGFNNN